MDLAKTFSDRLFEICLLKNITEESLIPKLTKDFQPKCFRNLKQGTYNSVLCILSFRCGCG